MTLGGPSGARASKLLEHKPSVFNKHTFKVCVNGHGLCQWSKNLSQNLTGVVISGNSERISPGVIRSEFGRPEGLWLISGRPTWWHIMPGKIHSELPEFATPVRFRPKFLENHTAVNLQKISRGLRGPIALRI